MSVLDPNTPQDPASAPAPGSVPAPRRGRGWGWWLVRLAIWVPVLVIVLLLGAAAALRTPQVQTRLVAYFSGVVQERINYKVTIGRVDFNFIDEIHLQNIVAYDLEGNRMLELPSTMLNFSVGRLLRRDVAIDQLFSEGGHVRIINSKTTGQVNISAFIEAINLWVDPTEHVSANPSNFYIYGATLQNFTLDVANEPKDSIRTGYDYNYLTFTNLTTKLENFRVRADTVELNMLALQAYQPRYNWPIHKLKGFFRMTRHHLTLAPFQAWVGKSYLADSVRLSYKTQNDLSDFVQKTYLHINLTKSRFHYQDVGLFAPSLAPIADSIRVAHATVDGRVCDLYMSRVNATFGQGSRVQGKAHFIGLPNVDTTYMQIALRPSYLLPADLYPYTPAPAHEYLKRMGPTDIEGTYTGTLKDFTFKGGAYGRNGALLTDLAMQVRTPATTTYKGTFETQDLAIGTLLQQQPLLGIISGKGRIEGKGLTLETAKMSIKAELQRLDIKQYPYHNVSLDATLALGQFDGVASVADSNLIADANGIIDLNRKRQFFDVEVNMQRGRLRQLGWVAQDLNLTGRATVNGAGSDPDNTEGVLRIENAMVNYQGKNLPINTLQFETWIEEKNRSIRLASDYVSGTLDGSFTFRALAQDLDAALNDYGRLFHNKVAMQNQTASYTDKQYDAALQLDLKNLTPVLRLFVDGLQVAPHAKVDADISKTRSMLLQGSMHADYLAYGNNVFDAVSADVATSKIQNQNNVLASATVTSSSQRFGNLLSKDLNITGSWQKDRIDFATSVHQENDSNYIELEGMLGFTAGTITASLQKARVRLLDSVWLVAPGNLITFDDRGIHADSLAFTTTNQRLEVSGTAGPLPTDTMHLIVDSLSAEFARVFIEGKYTGAATARINATSLLGAKTSLSGFLSIVDLTRNGLKLGNVKASLVPQAANASLELELEVNNGSQIILGGSGLLRPASLTDQMDLNFKLYKTPLAYLEPFFTSMASNWQGTASGSLSLNGTFSEPNLTGTTVIDNGGLTIDYLKARYFFADTLRLSKGLIDATGTQLSDAQGNIATLTRARVRHKYFQDFYIDMRGDLDNFQLLGTVEKDSKLYYGTAIGTGQMSIIGPIGDIDIVATLRTEKGTRLFLPLQTALAANTSRQSYIRFVSSDVPTKAVADSVALAKQDSAARTAKTLSGIHLAFNIELTPDAYGEIILDKQAGDAVSAYGYGRLKLNIDTRGDFSMTGRYNITTGTYKFTFANFINKTFDIKDGSSITWSGDPGAAQMDINAVYTSTVPFSPLVLGSLRKSGDSARIASEAARRYPVSVTMHLTGPMLQPTITLGLDIPNQYPATLAPYVASLQGLIANNEQELNKQVFSLLLLRSLSPIGLNSYATAGSSVGNLTELLSNQLSAWLSEVNQNLEVGVNLSGFNQQSFDNFQLRVSYTALDGRLKVTRNGGFTNTASQTTAASLAGDWTLEYNLTRDGRLRAKIFHRTNQTLANSGLSAGSQAMPTTQGASLLQTQAFSSLRELMPWLYKKKPEPLAIPQALKPTPKQLAKKQ